MSINDSGSANDRLVQGAATPSEAAKFPRMPAEVALRRITLIKALGEVLPVEAFAHLFGISKGAVNLMRLKLSMALPAKRAKQIRQAFLTAPRVPRYVILTDLEQSHVAETHRKLRKERNAQLTSALGTCDSWERFTLLVVQQAKIVPVRVLAAVFDRSTTTIRNIQRAGGTALTHGEKMKLLNSFIVSELPVLSAFSAPEQKIIRTTWHAMRKERLKRFDQAADAGAARIRKRLTAKLARAGDVERIPLYWQLRKILSGYPGIFGANWRAANRLSNRCKLCIYHRRKEADRADLFSRRKKRKLGRVLKGKEKRRFEAVIRLYGAAIPPHLIAALFEVGPGTVIRVRKKFHQILSPSAAHRLTFQWRVQDQMPPLPELTNLEHDTLERLWRAWAEETTAAMVSYEFHVHFLKERRQRARTETPVPEEAPCKSCGESYPRRREFFDSRSLKSRQPTCKPCHNRDTRLANFKQVQDGSYQGKAKDS